MKAISIWQPWASLCVTPDPKCPGRPLKQFETRSWAAPSSLVGKRILIHAAKKWNREMEGYRNWFHNAYPEVDENVDWDPVLGAIVGSVVLVQIYRAEQVRRQISHREDDFGDYSEGRSAWRLTGPVQFEEPIPWRGSQGFFDVPDELVVDRLAVHIPN